MRGLANEKAERAVLGACMLSHECLVTTSGILKPEDFYNIENLIAYKIMLEMLANNTPVDLVTFENEMIKQKVYDRIGGQPFLADLVCDIAVTANVAYYADIVKQYSLRRALLMTSNKLSQFAVDESKEVEEILSDAEKALFDVSLGEQKKNTVLIKDALEGVFVKIKENKGTYFSTRFIDLDKIIMGFQPGSLNVIAARPSMGKTALALNIAQFGGDMDAPVLIFSLEMTIEQLLLRMLAAQGVLENGANLTQLQTGAMSGEESNVLQESIKYLASRKIFINDESALSTTDFRSECRRFKLKHKDLALVVVDYLQLMTAATKKENRQYEIAEISRTLKAVAQEISCPIIALSQLSRETEKRVEKRPQLSDLRDSGAIEQDADMVLMLYRDDYYSSESPDLNSEAEIKVAKNRNGMTGTCKLVFRREYSRFLSCHYER